MSEKVYTLTESQIRELVLKYNKESVTIADLVATLPTVQAPVVPSVEKIRECIKDAHTDLKEWYPGTHYVHSLADLIRDHLLARTPQEQKPVVPSQPVSNPYKLPEIRVYEFEIDEGEGDHYVEFVRKWEFDDILDAHGYREPVEGVNEWDAMTKEEMWNEIQAVRKATDNDGTSGAPHVLVEAIVQERDQLRADIDKLLATPPPSNQVREAVIDANAEMYIQLLLKRIKRAELAFQDIIDFFASPDGEVATMAREALAALASDNEEVNRG